MKTTKFSWPNWKNWNNMAISVKKIWWKSSVTSTQMGQTQRQTNKRMVITHMGWLRSWVVSMLYSGAEWLGFKSEQRCCRVTVLGKLFTPIVPLFSKQQKLVAALLRVVRVTAGLVESNGSLPPGLWLTSPAGWLSRTGISSWTLRSAVEYELPLSLPLLVMRPPCSTLIALNVASLNFTQALASYA